VYYHVVNTGDKVFLADVWPAVIKVINYVLRVGSDGMSMAGPDGLATTPCSHGLPHEDVADNWLDIVNFGGQDAIINSYLVRAIAAVAEMATFLGDIYARDAAQYQALHDKTTIAFNAKFYNASAGLYSDWVDTEGNARNYFYVWQVGQLCFLFTRGFYLLLLPILYVFLTSLHSSVFAFNCCNIEHMHNSDLSFPTTPATFHPCSSQTAIQCHRPSVWDCQQDTSGCDDEQDRCLLRADEDEVQQDAGRVVVHTD